ncbi:MAG: prolyl oligopeptidase family serine peptidase [Pseudomonadota bacterium]
MQNSLVKMAGALAVLAGVWGASPSAALAQQPQQPQQLQPPLPSVESFFQQPKLSRVKFSPDGRSIALLLSAKDGRMMLATMDVATLTPKIVAHFADTDVAGFHWVNNQRLVYDLSDRQLAVGENYLAPGLFAVNKDGSDVRTLVDRSTKFVLQPRSSHMIVRILPWYTYFLDVISTADTDDVFVVQENDPENSSYKTFSLLRLNTVTGRSEGVQSPGNVVAWVVDNNGVPRIATTQDKGNSIVHYKDPKDDKWRKLAEFPTLSATASFQPMQFGPDGSLLVMANNGRDTSAVYRYDLEKNKIEAEPIVSLKGYDFSGHIFFDREAKKILGIRYEMDMQSTNWLDTRMQQIQQKIDAHLPGMLNLVTVAEQGKSDTVLVYTYSDIFPGLWQLYNTASDKFTPIGKTMPDIDPAKMGTKDMVRYTARDGLEIPAYLTLPKGKKKNLPMVVLVHGGPYVRGGEWRWDAQAQFLASRGYAVLEPEYRGSTGFGNKLFQAGWKQWGLAMQDDLADGAKWAIQQGYADPKRVCIAGASYGGYATLMGLIKDPALFRCGVNWIGVTDIKLMYTVAWSDTSDKWLQYGMPVLVGDPDKDAAQLKATSPVENAAKITQPLLLAYGGSDRRVPIVHGTTFYKAVHATNPKVEWVEYPEEGHGWKLLKTKVDFWTRVEKFLDQNIGKN